MNLFCTDEDVRYAISGSVWTLDALEVDHRALMESQQEASWEWDDVHVVLMSAEVAVLTGTLHGSITYKSGQIVSFEKVAMTMVLRRCDGEWQIINAHESEHHRDMHR
jgi:ketosteroid isomerase-like protein